MTLHNVRLITNSDETITSLWWRTAMCTNLGHYNSEPPQHVSWFVCRLDSLLLSGQNLRANAIS